MGQFWGGILFLSFMSLCLRYTVLHSLWGVGPWYHTWFFLLPLLLPGWYFQAQFYDLLKNLSFVLLLSF